MSFTVDDFQDLLRLLDQRPEWRAELRRHVLSDELLELPALMRQLTERVDALTAQVEALTERVDALAVAQARTDAQLATLTARVDTLVERMDGVITVPQQMLSDIKVLKDRVGENTGKLTQLGFAWRAPAYFGRLARRPRVLEPGPVADRLDEAVAAGQLTDDERNRLLDADLVLTGLRREDRAEIFLLAEISAGIGLYDVERAVERTRLLEKLGYPVIAAVAGDRIDPEPDAAARAAGVWRFVAGHVIPPDRPANL